MNRAICYRPIGVIHSPYHSAEDAPRRPCGFPGVTATVEVAKRYRAGLKDLAGFSHVLLIYHLHKARHAPLVLKPLLDRTPRGVFATRAPWRPNPIGVSVVRLKRVRGRFLEVSHVDMLDGSPLLDIKPYIPDLQEGERAKLGWLGRALRHAKSNRLRPVARPGAKRKNSYES
jgi:tRNA-Thr(GGU) m(6)t(6)A37 methyltransferase TsaA